MCEENVTGLSASPLSQGEEVLQSSLTLLDEATSHVLAARCSLVALLQDLSTVEKKKIKSYL